MRRYIVIVRCDDRQAAGNDTSCLYTPPDSSTLASVHPNVTDTLTTCEPWGLTITGGKKPYTVVLSATNSPVTTNLTMGAQYDVFTYPDRADPNGQLMGEYQRDVTYLRNLRDVSAKLSSLTSSLRQLLF